MPLPPSPKLSKITKKEKIFRLSVMTLLFSLNKQHNHLPFGSPRGKKQENKFCFLSQKRLNQVKLKITATIDSFDGGLIVMENS